MKPAAATDVFPCGGSVCGRTRWWLALTLRDAAIDVPLPLIAVSVGLTAIGIVFVIVRAVSG
jgi:hypothetical protein